MIELSTITIDYYDSNHIYNENKIVVLVNRYDLNFEVYSVINKKNELKPYNFLDAKQLNLIKKLVKKYV